MHQKPNIFAHSWKQCTEASNSPLGLRMPNSGDTEKYISRASKTPANSPTASLLFESPRDVLVKAFIWHASRTIPILLEDMLQFGGFTESRALCLTPGLFSVSAPDVCPLNACYLLNTELNCFGMDSSTPLYSLSRINRVYTRRIRCFVRLGLVTVTMNFGMDR